MLWIRGAFGAALFFACVQLFLFASNFFVYPIDKRQKRAILQKKVKDSQ